MARRAMRLQALVCVIAISVTGFSQARVVAAAEVAPISVAQLPNDPVGQCSSQAVRAAFAVCRLSGASPSCCSGLDAVFANSSSPAAWCLCIPQVLYKSVAVGSDSGLDVLGTLHKCRKASPGFETQWAAAAPTACPKITFGLNTAELVMQLGPDIVLESSRGRPAWAWANLLQYGQLMQDVPDIAPIWDHVVGGTFANFMYLVIILLPPMFLVAHHAVLMPLSAAYRALAPAERLVVAEHAVYIFVFSVSLIPQTVLAFTSMFKAWTGWYLDSAQIAALLGVFVASRAILYAIEASVRSVIKWSWLLIVHHQVFFLIVLLALWGRNPAVAGLGLVLDLFACHEAPLYVALVGYRLRWNPRLTQGILRGAMVWYVATRVLQSIILLYMIAGGAALPAVRHTPEFVVVSLLCGLLTLIQAYTLVIYRAVDRKLTAARAAAGGDKGGGSGSGGKGGLLLKSLRLNVPARSAAALGGAAELLRSVPARLHSRWPGSEPHRRHSAGSGSPSSLQSNDGHIEVVMSPLSRGEPKPESPSSHPVVQESVLWSTTHSAAGDQ